MTREEALAELLELGVPAERVDALLDEFDEGTYPRLVETIRAGDFVDEQDGGNDILGAARRVLGDRIDGLNVGDLGNTRQLADIGFNRLRGETPGPSMVGRIRDAGASQAAIEAAGSPEGQAAAAEAGLEEAPDDEMTAFFESYVNSTIPDFIAEQTGIVPDGDDVTQMLEAYERATGEAVDEQTFYLRFSLGDPMAQVAADAGLRGHTDNFVHVLANEGNVLQVREEEWGNLLGHWGTRPRDTALAMAQANQAQLDPGLLLAGRRLMGLTGRAPEEGPDLGEAIENIPNALRQWETGTDRALTAQNMFSNRPDRFRSGTEALQLRRYLDTYDDHSLALIAMEDPALARRIYDLGGPQDRDDELAVQSIFRRAGWIPGQDGSIPGVDRFDIEKYAAALGEGAGGGGGSGGGGGQSVTVDLPDPGRLNEAYRDLYRSWFQREPSEGEMAAFVGSVNSTIRAEAQQQFEQLNPGGGSFNVFKGERPQEREAQLIESTSVDLDAQLRGSLRSRPEYQQLFANMPEGLSEEEYVAQFAARAGQLLGSEEAPDAVRTGMESGDVNDVARQIFWGQGADGDNTTFMARSARMGQALEGML